MKAASLIVTVMLLAAYDLARAEDGARNPQATAKPSPPPANATRSSVSPQDEEPEEPDFAFIAGGPYTQKKNSIQFIMPGQWARRRTNFATGTFRHSEYGALLRTEWGFTDRLELDFIVPAEGERDRLGSMKLRSTFALSDAILGMRYRLLRESSAPFTLTMGPQVIFPSGSVASGTSFATVGYAWDTAAARDWRGPVFLYTSLNYSFFPSVRVAALSGNSRSFDLHNVFWGTAVGLRALEKPRGTSHHDIHVFLEYGLAREEGLESNPSGISKVSEVRTFFSPGLRYGFLTRTKKLFEIGVSFPVGLNDAAPRGGVILQIQFENIFGYKGE